MKITRFLIAALALFAIIFMVSCSTDDDSKKSSKGNDGCAHANIENGVCLDCSLQNNHDDFYFELSKDQSHYKLMAYLGTDTDIILPTEHEGIPVTEVGKEAFRFSSIKRVTIPEGYTTIGTRAFHTSVILEHISIPSTVTTVGERAFAYCNELKNISIPATITSIPEGAFENCESLKQVVLSEGTKQISTSAFAGCTSLESINIPASVTTIESGALSGIKKISGITLPVVEGEENPRYVIVSECLIDTTTGTIVAGCADSQIPVDETVIAIGELAFSGSDIKSVIIPENILTIGKGAFSYCLELESVTFPTLITEIPDNLFYNAVSLESVVIPEGVTRIGEYAFYYCTSLESVTMPQETLTEIGESAFQECIAMESFVMPHTVTTIGENLFHGCKSLESVEFSIALEILPKGTFVNCTSLKTVALTGMVSTVERYAFKGCTALTSVIFSAKLDIIEENAFNDCFSLITIYYGGTEKGWGRIEFGPSYLETKDEAGTVTSKVVLEGYEVVYNYVG